MVKGSSGLGACSRRTLLSGAASSVILSVGCVPGTGLSGAHSLASNGGRYGIAGYVPYWDQRRGFDVVHRHSDIFDSISPMWFSLGQHGEIVLADSQHTDVDPREVAFLRQKGITVLPTITNLRNGEWNPELVSSVLAQPALRRDHVGSITSFVEERGYDGIDVDYESLAAADRDYFSAFLTELGDALRSNGRMLTCSAYAKQSEPGEAPHNIAQNYDVLGRACHQVRLMTYDYHYATSEPGPVAPLEWMENVVRWASTRVHPSRLSLGIVLLGYDWPSGGEGRTVSYQEASALASEHDATVQRYGAGSTPHFAYVDGRGRNHEVWYEDAMSTQKKLGLVEAHGLGSAFLWRLGGEDPRTWRLLELAPA